MSCRTTRARSRRRSCGDVIIAPGQSLVCAITFTPRALGAAKGTLAIVSNAGSSPQAVGATGIGIPANLTVAPGTLNFGKVPHQHGERRQVRDAPEHHRCDLHYLEHRQCQCGLRSESELRRDAGDDHLCDKRGPCATRARIVRGCSGPAPRMAKGKGPLARASLSSFELAR